MRGLELIIKGNNRSAIRALKEVADQSNRTGDQVQRDSRKASAGFDQMGQSARRTRDHVSGLAGVLGLGGLAFGLKDVVTSGVAWQAQQAQLQVALKNTGNRSSETRRKILDAAEALSTRGGFGASQTLQGMTQFVRINGNASDAISKVTLATNIARSSGRDFTQVLRALMMAEQGRTTGLARLGVAVPKVKTAQDALRAAQLQGRDSMLALVAAGYKFTAQQKAQYALHNQITPAMLRQAQAQDALSSKNRVFSLLQQRYGGATRAFSATDAGRISNAQNTLDIAMKTASSKLLPVIAGMASGIASVITYLITHKSILIALGAVIGAVITTLTAYRIVTEVLRAKTILLSGAQTILGVATRVSALAQSRLATAAVTASVGAGQLGMSSRLTAGTMTLFGGGLSKLMGPLAGLARAATIAAAAWIGIRAAGKLQDAIRHHQHGRSALQGAILGAAGGAASGAVLGSVIPGAGTVIGGLAGGVAGAGAGLLTSFFNFNNGGVVKPRYLAAGGPVGMDTIPGWLTPGEGVVTTRGMSMLGERGLAMLNSGGGMGGRPIVINLTSVLRLQNGRELARTVTQEVLNRAARGPGSYSGGSLVTGAPGLPA